MLKEELFDFICCEFRGKQRQRAMNILYNEKLSKTELKLFYSNWLINLKFELRTLLKEYSELYQKHKVLNRCINKNTFDIVQTSNYIIIAKEMELKIFDLSKHISLLAYNVFEIIANIENLSLFNAHEISTIFSIPLDLVIEGMEKYKDTMFGAIFNLIITDCGENKHVQKNIDDVENIYLFPFYWSKNIEHFKLKGRKE